MNLIVGTKASEIHEVACWSGELIKTHINGHFELMKDKTHKSEVWGLAVHPIKQVFATCGADYTIRIWEE
jgi:WD40 repeat protein